MMNSARLEGLESRMLLSAVPTVELIDGTLIVTGVADAPNNLVVKLSQDGTQLLVVTPAAPAPPPVEPLEVVEEPVGDPVDPLAEDSGGETVDPPAEVTVGAPVALADVRQVLMVGGAMDDVLDASAVAVRAKIYGGLGNDSIKGSQVASQLIGGAGDDMIVGGAGSDFLKGGAGNDQLDGADGNDRIWGNAGNDSIVGGLGNDRIWGNQGDDVINGGDGADVMWGNQGKDKLFSDDDNPLGADDGDRDRLFGDKRDGPDALSYGPGDRAHQPGVKLKPVKMVKPSRK